MQHLRELRQKLGKKQKDIANELNLSVQVYCNYENGLREPSFDTLTRIADYFGVTVDYLLNHKEQQQSIIPQRFLILYNSLTPIQQEKVIAFMEGLLA